jgi:predicted transcriptional regulator
MNKLSTISTRLDEEVLKNIEKLANEMNLDRSALIRKFILDGYQHAMLRKYIELVHEGELTIEQAAEHSHVPVHRIIEIAREMNIEIGADASTIEHEKTVLEKHFVKSRK